MSPDVHSEQEQRKFRLAGRVSDRCPSKFIFYYSSLKDLKIVLPRIQSRCSIEDNENTDRMTKRVAEDKQDEPTISQTVTTLLKSRSAKTTPATRQLSSKLDQVIIFRLRTGHNSL